MKIIYIDNMTFEALKQEAIDKLASDHYVGVDVDGKLYVVCDDSEMHFENKGYDSAPFVAEEVL